MKLFEELKKDGTPLYGFRTWRAEVGGGFYRPDVWLNVGCGYYTREEIKQIISALQEALQE